MILVTGASGFVGCNVCRRLEEARRPFRALVRSPAKAADRGLPAGSLVVGDLFGDLGPALEGVHAVVHLAGLVRAVRSREFYRVNGSGTGLLVAALGAVAPQARLVHVSSLAAAGPSRDGASSGCDVAAACPVSHYGRSKLRGEEAVARSANPWLVLRPPIIYGPWDTDVLVVFRMLARGRGLLFEPEARHSLVHVDDLVTAILAAVDAEPVRCFVPITHPRPLARAAWLAAMAEALGTRARRFVRLPAPVAALAALCTEGWSRLSRHPPVFGLDKWREARAGSWVADAGPARDLIGFHARTDHPIGFRRTVEWYRAHGWL